tara:strand:+ start:422 stop:1003 length:582 start_codon:yes stop_codon:yes gene_type:complete
MKIFIATILLLTIFNCVSTNKELMSNGVEKNSDLIKSCTGRGSISSLGNYSGSLSFSFMSQNDSTFCQFQDFLGRKVLLLWLTEESIDAWNLIENKKYSHSNISEIMPVLSVLNPYHLINFLWGREITSNQIDVPKQAKIEIKLGKSDQNSSIVDKVIFIDNLNRQELSIKIDSRAFNQNYLDLKKYWDIIHS